jgi:hypothetical protein
MLLLFLLLRVNHKNIPLKEKLARIDWIGNFLVLLSTFSILYALTNAGTDYPWSSWNIILPLILGLTGIASFHTYEASRFCKYLTVPAHLFTNRTSAISFVLTFIHASLTQHALGSLLPSGILSGEPWCNSESVRGGPASNSSRASANCRCCGLYSYSFWQISTTPYCWPSRHGYRPSFLHDAPF